MVVPTLASRCAKRRRSSAICARISISAKLRCPLCCFRPTQGSDALKLRNRLADPLCGEYAPSDLVSPGSPQLGEVKSMWGDFRRLVILCGLMAGAAVVVATACSSNNGEISAQQACADLAAARCQKMQQCN